MSVFFTGKNIGDVNFNHRSLDGGNGITFSFLASRMIGEWIAGRRRDWFDDFALDRDVA